MPQTKTGLVVASCVCVACLVHLKPCLQAYAPLSIADSPSALLGLRCQHIDDLAAAVCAGAKVS